ncbi:2-amino-4-hydroxy-6-hydroxymethyldihydropteridine diphosphokinase [Aquabacter spiritensis]|uniref:2-amino-4-hydroxy-6-hydroxymethyldihydropteridine pyrophosphokinase n=1 Tax=Aquabacter spiritensis TaxID=933073 RepID=A0A4R3LQZ3_9HYPH|nr:2-amino-4-hydroxy-6-hydroxymethyldihydropteridine diphosphokinase [Aquabacter spiritensis]TCT02994.1 2-amino-4-hydroxy-6-hydroxymethyldihydropteridine diphosphokinase [Aquabacter spiritensis]
MSTPVTTAPERAYLCLGGNLGDTAARLRLACGVLARSGLTVRARSGFYRTPPWGPVAQPDFINQVVAVDSPVGPAALLAMCLRTERMMGRERVREQRYGPRAIDIDILLFGTRRVAREDLVLPHPRLRERAFALVPLAEIAPDAWIGEATAAQALARLDTKGIARLD